MTTAVAYTLAALVIALIVRDRRREVAARGKDVVIAQQRDTIRRQRRVVSGTPIHQLDEWRGDRS